jgi:hypothetical protein
MAHQDEYGHFYHFRPSDGLVEKIMPQLKEELSKDWKKFTKEIFFDHWEEIKKKMSLDTQEKEESYIREIKEYWGFDPRIEPETELEMIVVTIADSLRHSLVRYRHYYKNGEEILIAKKGVFTEEFYERVSHDLSSEDDAFEIIPKDFYDGLASELTEWTKSNPVFDEAGVIYGTKGNDMYITINWKEPDGMRF